MKKKILLMVLIIMILMVIVIASTACNRQVLDLKLKFEHAYVKVGENWIDVEVEKWCDYDGEQLQLILKDGSVLVVSSVNCILYQGTLPRN